MAFRKRKIFCIGFNKTGTYSLHGFFKECGLDSVHNANWAAYSQVKSGRSYFRHQCYSDSGDSCDYQKLDKWFPGSLFIYNDRSERQWLYSRVKHVLRHNEVLIPEKVLVDSRFGKMARDFVFDERAAIRKWLSEYRLHKKQVLAYFAGRQDFILINVPQDSQWQEKLRLFFDRNGFKYRRNQTIRAIHANKRAPDAVANEELLSSYFGLVDAVIDEFETAASSS